MARLKRHALTAVAAMLGLTTGAQAADSTTSAALLARIAALEARVQRQDDIYAIEKLTRSYGYYLDKKLWSEITPLWSDSGSVEISGRGLYKGRKSIDLFFKQVMGSGSEGLKPGQLFDHMILQGIVDVDPDGRRAHGRWRALQQVATVGKSEVLAEGPYEISYVKEGGVWKFDNLHYYDSYHVDPRKGWAAGGQVMHGPNKDYLPDAPPTEQYSNYPGVYVPPYHYPNPVTGRKWTIADTQRFSWSAAGPTNGPDTVPTQAR